MAAALWTLFACQAPCFAQGALNEATEEGIKAAYLYKFVAYVEWPETSTANGPFVIGVLGSPGLADELARMTMGRDVNGRPVSVLPVEPDVPIDSLHVMFIGARERNRLGEILAPARSLPLLTVTESTGALTDGSVINFLIDERRVRFEISLDAAAMSGLNISARLLAVAERVLRQADAP